MSWFNYAQTSSTRSKNNPNFTPEAHEARRKELEEKRVEQLRKKARQAFLKVCVSVPPSPSVSRDQVQLESTLQNQNLPLAFISIQEEKDHLTSLPGDFVINNIMDAEQLGAAKAVVGISENA